MKRSTYHPKSVTVAGIRYVVHADGSCYLDHPSGMRRVRDPRLCRALHAKAVGVK